MLLFFWLIFPAGVFAPSVNPDVKVSDILWGVAKPAKRGGFFNINLFSQYIRCCPAPEFFAVGHDRPRSAFDDLPDPASKRAAYEFLYGGIGDARHVFASLIDWNERR